MEDAFKYLGMKTDSTERLSSAIEKIMNKSLNFQILILDIRSTGIQGLKLCNDLRNQKYFIPIVLIVTQDNEIDGMIGLEAGADDYLTIPFHSRALIARIKALLRRTYGMQEECKITVGELIMNIPGREVMVSGIPVDLTAFEFNILKYLLEHKGRAVSREELAGDVWGDSTKAKRRLVDVHIAHIRAKLCNNARNDGGSIKTVRGMGYKFNFREE